MASKRSRPSGPTQPITEGVSPEDRRADMAKLARRRAAHFAHFKEDDDAPGGSNVHVGNNEARTLGPWSSAVELVNARQKALEDREDKRKERDRQGEEGEETEPCKPLWSPSRNTLLGPRQGAPAVPTLFSMCQAVLTEYVDCIDSLAGVPDTIRVKVSAHVCSMRKMSKEARRGLFLNPNPSILMVARLFVTGAPVEVVLTDCHQLDAASMTELVQECVTHGLERLELGVCGRGFGDPQAELLGKHGPLTKMTHLTLAGAYRLSDAGLETAMSALPGLHSLSVPQGSRLTGSAIGRLPDLLPHLSRLEIQDCRGLAPEMLIAALPCMTRLKALRMDGMDQVDDDVLLAAATAPCLEELGISYTQVTDVGMTVLSQSCPGLLILHMDECLKVTDVGLYALAAGCKGLRALSARRCKVTDEALAMVAERGCLQRLLLSGVNGCGDKTMQALAMNCKESLEVLDVSFCRGVSEQALGLVADKCRLLSNIILFGCSHVGNKFLHGHSNDNLVSIVGTGTICAA